MSNNLCYDIGHDIADVIRMIVGDKFEVWSTGTIDPDYYKGHMEMGNMGGLQLTITLKDYPHHPTMEQYEAYFKKMRA